MKLVKAGEQRYKSENGRFFITKVWSRASGKYQWLMYDKEGENKNFNTLAECKRYLSAIEG